MHLEVLPFASSNARRGGLHNWAIFSSQLLIAIQHAQDLRPLGKAFEGILF